MQDIGIWNEIQDGPLHFESSHFVHFPGADGRHLVTLTGLAKGEECGVDSETWTERRVHLMLRFPDICPPGKVFHVEKWAPFATISGIDKGGDNHNGGWAVDGFGLDPLNHDIATGIQVFVDFRVRGALFRLFQIGYSLTLAGRFVDQPPVGPIDR